MSPKIAYVVKRYPRFSETFIVNEILAHEAVGVPIHIFSLRPPVDTHFQDLISRVRAPLTYLSDGRVKGAEFWIAMRELGQCLPEFTERFSHALSTNEVLDVYCGLRLAKECLRQGITHLHAHFASSSATAASIASSLTGIPFSITAHAKDIFHESVNQKELEEKLRRASVTFTVSNFNYAYLTQRFAKASNQIVRLYNGMHLPDFPYHSPQSRDHTIVAVGRFVEKKGFADLLHACRHLEDRGVDFRCQLIGGGELESRLAQLVNDLRLSHRVQLLGPQPQGSVKRWIQSASVMAVPCVEGDDGNRDGLPTVLLESMALGTPCVSTRVTGIPEVVRDKQTGILISERAPRELADALESLLSNATERVRYARAARQLMEEEFDIEKNAAIQRKYFFRNRENPLASTCQEMEVAV